MIENGPGSRDDPAAEADVTGTAARSRNPVSPESATDAPRDDHSDSASVTPAAGVIEMSWTPRVGDYAEVNRLPPRTRHAGRIVTFGIRVVGMFLAVVFGSSAVVAGLNHSWGAVLLLAFLSLVPLLLVVSRSSARLQSRAAAPQAGQGPVLGRDEAAAALYTAKPARAVLMPGVGVRIINSVGTTEYPWSSFTEARERRRVFVLRLRDAWPSLPLAKRGVKAPATVADVAAMLAAEVH